MTWQEFKDYIDKKLEEKGYNSSIIINYIDITYGSAEELVVEIKDKELIVW